MSRTFRRARRALLIAPALLLLTAANGGTGAAAGLPAPAPAPSLSAPTVVDVKPIILPIPTPTPSPSLLPGQLPPVGTVGGAGGPGVPSQTPADATSPTGTAVAPASGPAGPSLARPEDYVPSAQEAADLPNNAQRLYYEGEQLILADQFAQFEKEFGAAALAAGGGAGAFGPPLISTKNILITQLFGCTSFDLEPYNGGCSSKHWHTGVDFAVPQGTPVFAADAGVARVFRDPGGYGNHVVVMHGNGFVTLYGHLSAFGVQDGQVVKRGDLVGLAGSTGFSTGSHLHFEIRQESQYLDPCVFIGCRG